MKTQLIAIGIMAALCAQPAHAKSNIATGMIIGGSILAGVVVAGGAAVWYGVAHHKKKVTALATKQAVEGTVIHVPVVVKPATASVTPAEPSLLR